MRRPRGASPASSTSAWRSRAIGLKTEFEQKKVAALKADWTNQNPEITALLSAQQRSGVPLYLYYAPGAQTAIVLPQILTESIVLAALKS